MWLRGSVSMTFETIFVSEESGKKADSTRKHTVTVWVVLLNACGHFLVQSNRTCLLDFPRSLSFQDSVLLPKPDFWFLDLIMWLLELEKSSSLNLRHYKTEIGCGEEKREKEEQEGGVQEAQEDRERRKSDQWGPWAPRPGMLKEGLAALGLSKHILHKWKNGREGGCEQRLLSATLLRTLFPLTCSCYSWVPPLAYSLKTWGRWLPACLWDPGPPTMAPGETFPGLRGDLVGPCSTSSAAVNYSWHSPKVAAFTVSPVLIHKERTSKVDTLSERS